MIREELENIAELYLDGSGSYTSSRYEDDDKDDEEEILIREEMIEFLDGTNVKYKLAITDGFDSCGYSCDVLSIAWIENDDIELYNILLECY